MIHHNLLPGSKQAKFLPQKTKKRSAVGGSFSLHLSWQPARESLGWNCNYFYYYYSYILCIICNFGPADKANNKRKHFTINHPGPTQIMHAKKKQHSFAFGQSRTTKMFIYGAWLSWLGNCVRKSIVFTHVDTIFGAVTISTEILEAGMHAMSHNE